MVVQTPAKTETVGDVFPFTEVESRLRAGIAEAAEESGNLRDEWEPLLDSLRMVSVLVDLEDIFDFPLPPEKIVRRGGYSKQEEAYEHMFGQLCDLWEEKHNSGENS